MAKTTKGVTGTETRRTKEYDVWGLFAVCSVSMWHSTTDNVDSALTQRRGVYQNGNNRAAVLLRNG